MCAAKEASALGITHRESGIPTLIVLDTHGTVITTAGVHDIRAHGAAAIDTWGSKAYTMKDTKADNKETETDVLDNCCIGTEVCKNGGTC